MEPMLIALVVITLIAVVVLTVVVVRQQSGGGAPPPTNNPFMNPETLLAPVREQMQALQQSVNATREASAAAQSTMLEQLRQVSQQNNALYRQGQELGVATTQISTALQGTGVAGDWGELQLQRTVELAGLSRHVSFMDQASVTTADGRKRPDLVVNLPDGRRIVVDAKAPLIDFAQGADSAKKQADALAAHVKDLSLRNYAGVIEGSIDFVVLFVPTEGIMATALSTNPSLSEDAIRQKVLLATPMTLLALLRAVEFGWRQVAQAENSAQIAQQAAELWDRLATFVDHFNKVGNGLRTAIDNYNSAAGSLETSVKPQARRVRALGISPKKELKDTPEITESNRSANWDN